ncbi:ubiquinone biosynthesis protein UbiB [Chromobacterium subtsugae]|uniref:Ubiquinone biosynthesis protein UbiB n=1 Tax=Chromobacterium subtsugae TaxID=251747 RepID=A0ABS7FDY9_9NEIS|nr:MULTISPECIES: AarF/UbiB family protein [Chromobacterium]KUM03016.1 ubiquinone biosynthesis protein UbiB [Chromobacterium subtsugae]KZE85975.1 ubiquinone biosynthesis protein UbiB [Chromobacterium sp. F49]MBW7567348.1 ubiquinone biosynthesis protein UbiB [Chromobacterium subtsugae]MBW8287514.1 ubiquinone biosynthesis protein UbiB [Chromobacterium subtsugae]
MIRETLIAMRDLPRLREISGILIRHGLGEFAQRLKLPRAVEKAGEWLNLGLPDGAAGQPTAVRVRLAFEELGPTFIKLGQILSTRVDVFPPDWIDEFEKLQNQVPQVPAAAVKKLIREALGAEPDELFAEFDMRPIGSASIAQVHRARLPDGREVAVKLRRPGIMEKVEADLRILAHLAHLLELEFPELRRYQPSSIVAQFSRSLRRELDLAIEARNMERFAKDFADDPHVVVPKVHWQYTRAAVNVQDFVDGVSAGELARLESSGLDPVLLAQRGADAVLKMILVNGFFHADPHPGNVFFLAEHRIAFIDFGMVGRISHVRRDEIVDLLSAVAEHNEHGIIDVLVEWTGNTPVDMQKFADEVGEFMFQYEHVPLKGLNISQLIADIMTLIRNHGIVLPPDMAMLFKALITLEGLGRQLNPDFQLVAHITPFVKELIVARYHPAALLKRGRQSLSEGLEMITGLPRDLVRIGRDMRHGKFRVNLDLQRLDNFGKQLDRSSNRLTMGIVTGCLIIGSSIVMTVNAGPKLFGLPFFGFVGFMLALFNSVWLVWSIWRSGKDL